MATANTSGEALLALNQTQSVNGFASDADAIAILGSNVNSMFLVIMGTIIIFMQAGFGFLEAGSIRAKNTTNILIKNFADLTFGGLGFWLVGYGLAFGESNSGIIGTSYFGAIGLPVESYSHLFFQCTFAATCATIVSGAIAERCNFNSYIIFSTILTAIVYPISTHWCWGADGWLSSRGFYDFAGSGVVHISGGVHAIVGAVILGPRIDRFRDSNSKYIAGHSIPLISLGGFILIFGFMAFNAGSQASISEAGDGTAIGSAVVSTLLACGAGGVTILVAWKFMPCGDGSWSLAKSVNGMLAGMVSVCAGCDAYNAWTAVILGTISSVIYLMLSLILVSFKVDDPLDAFAIHFGGGTFGLIAGPIARIGGVLSSGSEESMNMLMWNCIGCGVLVAYNLAAATIHFGILDRLGVLRVTADSEIRGLDVLKHNEKAYGFGTGLTPRATPPPSFLPSNVNHNILTVATNKIIPR